MKKFTMRDENFNCENCGNEVKKLNYTARDHCPYCLFSKHLDILPGDRENKCHGLLRPVGVEKYKDKYKILYICDRCGDSHRNISANDDDFSKIIELSVQK